MWARTFLRGHLEWWMAWGISLAVGIRGMQGFPPQESRTCQRIGPHASASQYLLRASVIAESYAQTRPPHWHSENTASRGVPGDSYWLCPARSTFSPPVARSSGRGTGRGPRVHPVLWALGGRQHRRCENKPAQGNALGTPEKNEQAMKGRHTLLRPFRAGSVLTRDPGRCAGLACLRAFGPPKTTPEVHDRL